MDVYCVGMYRACSTWQYEVTAHLLERHRGADRLGYLTGEEFDALPPDRAGRRWRILKSHEGHPRFAEALASGRARAVYAYRDVRDVTFSLMHKRRAGFRDLLRRGMIHQVLANDHFWAGRPGVLVQRYEDLIADPARGVAELAEHLGIELATGEAEEVARAYSFQANRARARRLVARLRAAGVDLARPANAQFYDGKTLLHWNHLRDGRAGSWREEATPRQRAILARVVDGWLASHGYEPGPTPKARRPLAERVHDEIDLARGRLACALRCLALRHPRAARVVKRSLGIAPEVSAARSEGEAEGTGSDRQGTGARLPHRLDEGDLAGTAAELSA